MADKFRVGMKVRIVKSKKYTHLLGTEHVVTGATREYTGKDGRKWRGYDIGLVIDGRLRIIPQEKDLERVFTPPAAGLQRIASLAKELAA